MKDFSFGMSGVPTIPTHQGRASSAVTVLLHVALFAVLIGIKTHPVRVTSAGPMRSSIAAYVPGPVGTAGTSVPKAAPKSAPIEPKKTTTIARAAKPAPTDDQSDAGQSSGVAGVPGGQAGGGPVRLGSGGGLTLLKKVTPVYPTIMQSARMRGQVVLDAIIHHDGTIGDVTVLQSTNDAFAQAAIGAVKQWRYTPIPFEGIVTVTVNFTLPG